MRFRRDLLIVSFVLALSVMAGGCSRPAAAPPVATPKSGSPTPAATPVYVPVSPLPTPTPTVPVPAATPPATPSPALTPSASGTAIKARASAGILNVTGYRLQRTILTTKWPTDSRSDAAVTTVSGNLALDLPGRQMQMDNDITVVSPPGQPSVPPLHNSVYIVNGTTYIMGLFPQQPQQWTRTGTDDAYWQLQDQSKQLVALLAPSGVSVAAPEAVQSGNLDVPCDVLVVTPDLAKFVALLAQQPGVQLPQGAPAGIDFSQIVKRAAMKVWLAQTSGLPVKAEFDMSLQIGPAQVPALTRDVSMEVSGTMLFYDYNQALSIQLPPAATGAIDLHLQPAQ